MEQWLTLASIWIAMGAWTLAICLFRRPGIARGVWGGALGAYLLHIVLAYAVFYDWSHRIAWDQTALETEAVTGWRSGIGLLVNFAFAGAIAVDLVRQIRGRRSSPWIAVLVVFMILNGAVVFGQGPVRWYGIGLLLVVSITVLCGAFRRREGIGNGNPE